MTQGKKKKKHREASRVRGERARESVSSQVGTVTAVAGKSVRSRSAGSRALGLSGSRALPRLRHCTGESVEDEAVPALRLLDGLLDDAHHDVVGHQRAGLHRVLGAHAVGRLGGDGGAEHVARGEVAQAVVVLDLRRLRPLPATRGA